MVRIRSLTRSDWTDCWTLIEPVIRAGETYPYDRALGEAEMFHLWVDLPAATYVALDDNDRLLGTYYLKANQPGQGAHVCNCGYMVSEQARGLGVATAMCEHSQDEAKTLGFRAMQFNLVVSTNAGAVYLWDKLGFQTVGRLPGAFRHPTKGFVDALVMFKQLSS